jgi:hypothetical protein
LLQKDFQRPTKRRPDTAVGMELVSPKGIRITNVQEGFMTDLLIATREAQVRLCQNLQDQPLGRAAWNRLLETSETHSIFLTYQWLATWWDCFKDSAEL